MPTYEFICRSCSKDFSVTTSVKDLGQGQIKCPDCGTKDVKQQMALFMSKTSHKG